MYVYILNLSENRKGMNIYLKVYYLHIKRKNYKITDSLN